MNTFDRIQLIIEVMAPFCANSNDPEAVFQIESKITNSDEWAKIKASHSDELEIEFDSDSDPFIRVYDDETGELEKIYFPLEWVYIYTAECHCSKYIDVEYQSVHEFNKSSTSYCLWCGRDDWRDGCYAYKALRSEGDIEEAILDGFKLYEPEKITAVYSNFKSDLA